MAGSINKVTLLGNVGRDPEIRSTNSGDRIANLSIATSETWNDRASGERKERTEWHRVVVFNDGLVGVIEKYVTKGSKIYVEGALQTRKWTDQSGAEKFATEIVLTKFRGDLVLLSGREQQASEPAPGRAAPRRTSQRPPAQQERRKYDDIDDEIPF